MALTKDKVLSSISEEQIWLKFFGDFKLSELYKSPLRDEKSPSFNIYKGGGGRLFYKDFGGDSGDVFDYIMKMQRVSFMESLGLIANAFGIDSEGVIVNKRYQFEQMPNVIMGVRTPFNWEEKPFPEFGEQIDFWEKYGITIKELTEYDVRNIKHYSFENQRGFHSRQCRPFDPIYLFIHNEDCDSVRFYQPKTHLKLLKWCGNTLSYDLFGFKQIKEHQKIVGLLAGQKDCLSLYANTSIRAISLPSESATLTDDLYEDIMSKTDNMFVMYDNDAAGLKFAEKIKERFDVPIVSMSKITKLKDTSDFYEYYNKEFPSQDLLKDLILNSI